MRVLAIADPHLSKAEPKPMDIFGPGWQGHPERFFEGWLEVVHEEDLVLIPGDISWAMKLADALLDLRDIAALPGRKVLLRGNHDYWWPSISKLRRALPAGMDAVQNDALQVGPVVIAGTRGWVCPGSPEFSTQDEKIYQRELTRLELSLQAARTLNGDTLIVMLHFPPTNPRREPSGFTELLRQYHPDALVYGHLHGADQRYQVSAVGSTEVHFVAADALDFKPRVVMEIP